MTSSKHESDPAAPTKGWILYDGGCGFCFRWVHFWEKVVAGRGFALKDLQSAYSDGSLQISQENLLDDIQVLTRAGKLKSGADVYLYVTQAYESCPSTEQTRNELARRILPKWARKWSRTRRAREKHTI